MNRAELRKNVDTIVIMMFENRSFDHLLGHLSLPQFGGRTDVDGITDLASPAFRNPAQNGTMESPFLVKDAAFAEDLPHERDFVATQLAVARLTGTATMTGFVRAYEQFTESTGVLNPPPMQILTPDSLPATSFLAEEYMVCDRWFAPLPTSTQPNRLMSLCGYTGIDETHSELMPDQRTLFDWLDAHGVSWRVYSAGISFWLLMKRLWPRVLSNKFRRLSELSRDVQFEPKASWPKVILIEPDYEDSPVHTSGHASDNHPPLSVAFGESLLQQVYDALGANEARWKKSALIVTYDEHGGFFDHVPPVENVEHAPGPNWTSREKFTTTGVRVPALIVSPFVARRSVSHVVLDHTSILQLLAERFGKAGESYSPEVDGRRAAGIGSVSALLEANAARPSTYVEPPDVKISAKVELQVTREPKTPSQHAFVAAVEAVADARQVAALKKYPQLAHWLRP
jgi:phospholipase C